MAWLKPCLVAIYPVLNLAYVPRGMARFSLGAIWHVLDLAYVPHGMAKLSLGATWHG